MSNGWRLELMKWGDGNDTLAFWDSLHGDDAVFILTDEGVFRRDYEGEDSHEVLTLVDLPQALRELLRKLEERD